MLYGIAPKTWENPKRNFGGAIRVGSLKLIVGDAGTPSGWIPPSDSIGLDDDTQVDAVMKLFANSEESKLGERHLKMRLYDLAKDPLEKNDLSGQRKGMTKLRIKKHR